MAIMWTLGCDASDPHRIAEFWKLALGYISEPGYENAHCTSIIDPEGMEGENYNMCHFWSNFEIARLDFFRSKEYEEFFQMMDRSGGFWMERVCLS